MATKAKPATIAGRAEGKIIFKNFLVRYSQGSYLPQLSCEIDDKKKLSLKHKRNQTMKMT